jgi:hypothetical protein
MMTETLGGLAWRRIMPEGGAATWRARFIESAERLFAISIDISQCEIVYAAPPQNFSMQEKYFHIEKY